jgi:hypothetical protein
MLTHYIPGTFLNFCLKIAGKFSFMTKLTQLQGFLLNNLLILIHAKKCTEDNVRYVSPTLLNKKYIKLFWPYNSIAHM